MKNTNGMLSLAASVALTLCFSSAEATTFDAGQALKATMLSTQDNPCTDANNGGWTFGTAPSVVGGAVTAMTKTDQPWGDTFKGFTIAAGGVPTINVNIGDVPVACINELTDNNHPIDPGEIVMHPNAYGNGNTYDVIRFVVPQTDVYRILATFRDVSSGPSPEPGADVYVVINGQQLLSSAVVSVDTTPPVGSVPSFTADIRSMPLALGDTIDFVVGPNGGSHGNDGTALKATITTQAPGEFNLISLDLNGYKPGDDPVPGTNKTYSGAARVGADGDFWNSATIATATFTKLTVATLKLSDGITHSTVSFSINAMGGGLLHADCIPLEYSLNPLLDDYLYIDDLTTNSFTIAGLEPNATYDLYFYSGAGKFSRPGHFMINGTAYDSIFKWFPGSEGGDYAVCLAITADGNGAITGFFYKGDPDMDTTFDGLQIVGRFPHAEIVNLDINGYYPGSGDLMPVASDTYAGAARVGNAGDFWNHVAVANFTVTGIIAPSLKLSDGLTNSTVCFTMMAGNGGLLGADRMPPENSANALLDDCVYIYESTQPTNSFTISGLEPEAAYDLYFYCRGGMNDNFPGRFIINDVAYDSIDQAFPADGGADYALCAGITADSGGMITGDFCQVGSRDLAATFDGLQIAGTFPRQHAEIVNLDINGYKPDRHSEPGAADFFSGAAVIGAAGDFWNQTSVPYEALTGFTTRHLKLTDGQSNSTVTFSLSADSGGLLKADRIAIGSSVNKLLGDYIFINHDEAYSHPFTISGLAPNTPYDLYFYSAAGIYNTPGRFTINSVDYDSDYACFSANHGDLAACTGIMADANGVITGAFSRGSTGDATLNGVQISGKIPRLALGTVLMLQ